MEGTLYMDDSNQTEDGVGDVPELQEPLWEFNERQRQIEQERVDERRTRNSKKATMPITPSV